MKRYLTLIAALALVTSLLAAVHLNTRADAQPGELPIAFGGETHVVSLERLALVPVAGTIVNGRGEEKDISGEGAALRDVLALAGAPEDISKVTVTASDEFSAVLTGEEIAEEGRVWLMKDGDELRLVVFGDPNARRNVKHVARIEAE